VNDAEAPVRHRWLRINRVLRVMQEHDGAWKACFEITLEFRNAVTLRTEIRRAGAK
jgi:hypothetical protein